MPHEIKDLEILLKEIAPRATKCIVKPIPNENITKVKLRTKKYLYTYKVSSDNVKSVLDSIKKVNKKITVETL